MSGWYSEILGELFGSQTPLAGRGIGMCSPWSLSGSREQIVSYGQEAQTKHHLTLLPLSFLGKAAGEERSLGFFLWDFSFSRGYHSPEW